MQLKKGLNRFVFVVPRLKMVIKLPFISFFKAFRYSALYAKPKNWKHFKDEFGNYKVETLHSLKWYLFRGICSNWREFRFYQKTHNPFLQPTYFSFFGLLNIQRYGDICRLKKIDLWTQLLRLTNRDVVKDSHHFDNPNNFSFRDGKLRIHDYGSLKSQMVVSHYGEKIVKDFDPSFSHEGKKRIKTVP